MRPTLIAICYILLLFFRFAAGLAQGGKVTATMVLLFELTTARWRSVVNSVWTIGACVFGRGMASLMASYIFSAPSETRHEITIQLILIIDASA
ncbi:unnamed protein product [Protopolystoma xenopodis]|uniref:Major facilitator superfamily (MFS) profile domain-containing protein n=1 Tax=Protopolystoma xenopodis TaxID=117903 RepID=A0A3S5ANW1_9PLAT|nr:unnamed protein product [Protopolystoma xenopodis]